MSPALREAAGLRVRTARLELVAADAALREAAGLGRHALARALDAVIPGEWPPEAYDRRLAAYARDVAVGAPDEPGWSAWYLLLRDDAGGAPTAAGLCGFAGPPDDGGTVEVVCSVLPGFRGDGFAREAVAALVGRAFADPRVGCVAAEVPPSLPAAMRALARAGFRPAAPDDAPTDAVRFVLTREEHGGDG